MRRAVASGPDLFAAVALADARAVAMAAEQDRATAARRYQLAPHGERERRLSVLQEAAQEALRADIAYQRARREAGL